MNKAINFSNSSILLLVILLLLITVNNIFIYESRMAKIAEQYSIKQTQFTGWASSEARICINAPPVLNLSSCNETMAEGFKYECQFDYYDQNNHSVLFSAGFITPLHLFNISSTGLINFTPSNESNGYHTANITVDDQANCSNSIRSYLWDIEVLLVNHAPYLNRTIPTTTFNKDVSTLAFNLNDHFKDPDNDALSYRVLQLSSGINITITNANVWLYSSQCINTTAIFIATDPGNLSANSNPVLLKVNCGLPGTGANEGAGGGAGGFGGPDCESNWQCHEWSECLSNGTRTRVCEDVAGCYDQDYLFSENCTYQPPRDCIPDWRCDPWSICYMNNTRTRKCVDVNFCDDETGRPEITELCEYVPTCFDGVQNGLETGVDCGGPVCEPCRIVENPIMIPDELNNIWVMLAAILIALSLLLLAIYKVFREPINKFFVRLGWMFAGKHAKSVLLDKKDAEDLLKRMFYFERKLSNSTEADAGKRALEIASLTRVFFEKTVHVPYEFRYDELILALKRLGLKSSKSLNQILGELFKFVNDFEFNKTKTSIEEMQLLIEELIQIVYTVSEPGLKKYRDSKEKQPKEESLKGMLLKLANVEIALQYNEIDVAKEKFLKTYEDYEMLSELEKSTVYAHIQRLNREIAYLQGLVFEHENK
ncbi:MAG: hypothetical protein V1659_03560 [Candidatus Woesearchaeota archaeon]